MVLSHLNGVMFSVEEATDRSALSKSIGIAIFIIEGNSFLLKMDCPFRSTIISRGKDT